MFYTKKKKTKKRKKNMGHYASNALKTTKKTKHSYKKNVLQDH